MKVYSLLQIVFFVIPFIFCGVSSTAENAASVDPMFLVYVSAEGEDSGDGSVENPFATLERARQEVRSMNKDMDGDIIVEVGAGDYFLEKPFRLGRADSGSNGYRVIYRGAGSPGAARLLGGRILGGWEALGDGLYWTKVPRDTSFDTLYENGVRARKARYPNYEFDARFPFSGATYFTAAKGGTDGFVWERDDLNFLREVDSGDELNAVIWPWGFADWQKMTRRVRGIDFGRKFVSLPDHDRRGAPALSTGSRYYLEGALDFLDQPGEFHLDRETGRLIYWPRFGDPSGREIIAPVLDSIVVLEGESAIEPVRDVIIEGFTLAFTDTYPFLAGPSHFPWAPADPHGALGEGAFGTVHLRYTEDVAIRFNYVKGSGFSGIYLDRSNKSDLIYGNWIEDSGISGIVLAYHRERRSHPDDVNAGNRIENNLIHGLGTIGVDSAGVNLWGGHDNQVIHNEIFNGARYAVSLRGPYTQMRMHGEDRRIGDTKRPVTENNWIAYNFFHHLGQDSGDMGAIHMSGISSQDHHPVNRLEQNLITDMAAHHSMKDLQPNGIFFDYTEGVTDQELVDIEVRRTASPFRTNRTDVRHLYENVSWREGFDPERMKYEQIGLQNEFPENFGAPGEVRDIRVAEKKQGSDTLLRVAWTPPSDPDFSGVWIFVEGDASSEPIFVPAGKSSGALLRPNVGRPLQLRLMTVDPFGNRSRGILVPAAEKPSLLADLELDGVQGGIEVRWKPEIRAEDDLRVSLIGADQSKTVSLSEEFLRLSGLRDGIIYEIKVERIDARGYVWPVALRKIAAGEGVPLPTDPVAWWTFDEERLSQGQSIGDRSGNGYTLFVEGTGLELVPGRFGQAVRFSGDGSHLRVLDPSGLEPGDTDYALSLWMHREASDKMAGRIVDFGGGSRGTWEHWGAEPVGSPGDGGGIGLIANDYSVGGLLRDSHNGSVRPSEKGFHFAGEWHHLVLNVRRDNRMEVWVDGQLVTTAGLKERVTGAIRPEGEFLIGRAERPEHPNMIWTGLLDQVRVFQRALSSDEIAALFEESP